MNMAGGKAFSGTVILVAPAYNRSGYGVGARALVRNWHRHGIKVRLVPVNEAESGVDDFDLTWLKTLESTPLLEPVVAVFLHVPNSVWLSVDLPPDCPRIMFTTFDSAIQGNAPPAAWVEVCRQMDQVWLAFPEEAKLWERAGLDPSRIRIIELPHGWVDNPALPLLRDPAQAQGRIFRFLSLAMFQPRRRWNTLLEAFLTEFADNPEVELLFKVNYPSWHPQPDRPQKDFQEMVRDLRARIQSRAKVTIDESLGTRLGICDLLDSADLYVSTDTCPTAPVFEALLRAKRVVIPATFRNFYPPAACTFIEEYAEDKTPITDAILAYQPHHRDRSMPLLRVDEVRRALRFAYEQTAAQARQPWEGWEAWMVGLSGKLKLQAESCHDALADAVLRKRGEAHPAVIWEGSQFLYHSLALVNRQLCASLLDAGRLELSLIPFEKDQFDGANVPHLKRLAKRVNAPLSRPVAVHVRHQWPPKFEAPPEGAWVMIQPWEFGGIPSSWVAPMRDEVDEIWVPSTWVRDCYIQSGLSPDQVVVVPNGVDGDRFKPEGGRFPLKTRKAFKFLFLGGTIHRKGVDVLLSAYAAAFRKKDDVCLVIKGFGADSVYAHSGLDEKLKAFRQDSSAPEVEYLPETLSESHIADLYRACDALVHPYRGEGFGLPVAEAKATGLPVIVTGAGACLDFCGPEDSYLIPSHRSPLQKVDAYLPSSAGFWLEEPDAGALGALMQQVVAHPEEAEAKARLGRERILRDFTWGRAAAIAEARLAVLATKEPRRFRQGQSSPQQCLLGFLLRPDRNGDAWMRALLAYLDAFRPGEPVILLLWTGGDLPRQDVETLVIQTAAHRGMETFADVAVIEGPEEVAEFADRCTSLIRLMPEHALDILSEEAALRIRLNQAFRKS